MIEFGFRVGAHKGCGVCEHMHLSKFIEVLWKRSLGQGKFKRQVLHGLARRRWSQCQLTFTLGRVHI